MRHSGTRSLAGYRGTSARGPGSGLQAEPKVDLGSQTIRTESGDLKLKQSGDEANENVDKK